MFIISNKSNDKKPFYKNQPFYFFIDFLRYLVYNFTYILGEKI